jgi:hypothetical protein
MFPVSEQTFNILESDQRDIFVNSVVESLCHEMPEFANDLRYGELKQLVYTELDRAERWGIEEEEAIGIMSGISLAFDADVFDDPDFAEFIAEHEGDAVERLNAVLDAFDDES